MLGNRDRRQVLNAADDLERRVDALPRFSDAPDEYRKAIDDLADHLQTRLSARATVRQRWDGASISMLGYRATSTSGLAQACRNWIHQAREKAAK